MKKIKIYGTSLAVSFCLAYFSFIFILTFFCLFLALFILRSTPLVAIAFKEFRSLFSSFLGYLVFFGFTILLFYLYEGANLRLAQMSRMSPYNVAPLGAYFHGHGLSIAFLIMIPTMTMRLFAEERYNKTYELMLTYPIEEWHWVLGKFLGILSYFMLLWIPSSLHIFLIWLNGSLDIGQVCSIYFSLMLYTGVFLSIGMAASCFFTTQLAAFISTVLLLLPFHGHIFWDEASFLPGFASSFFLERHLEMATRGKISSYAFFLFFSMTVFFLYLTTRLVQSHRWFPGPFGRIVWEKYKKYFGLFFLIFISFSAFFLYLSMPWGVLFSFLLMPYFFTKKLQKETQYSIILGSEAVLGIVSSLVILFIVNYLSYSYETFMDWSYQKAFSLDSHIVDLLQKKLSPGDQIQVIALLGYSEKHRHEHTERDNERYFILKEMFRKIAESINKPGEKNFSYQFLHPVPGEEKVSKYLVKEKEQKQKIALLQNNYGIVGYREVVLLYRDRYYVLEDHELFEKKLTRDQLPRLLVLWRKIYESGGIEEPPYEDQEKAFERLKEIANPEMLSIFPHLYLEQNIVNAMLNLIHGLPRNVYFTQGQGEKTILGDLAEDYKTAYRLGNLLKRQNFSIRTLSLGQAQGIPEDCSILAILGTDRFSHFSAQSLSLIEKYLQRGGNILLCMESHSDAGLVAWAEKQGIQIQPKTFTFVFPGYKEKKSTVFPLDSFVQDPYHPISKRFQEMQERESFHQPPYNQIIVGNSCPVVPISSKNTTSILFVPQRAIAYPEQSQKLSPSPQSIGVILEKEGQGKLVVVGDTLFISDTPYYESGMQNSIPYILLGSNRFVLPCLLEYMAKQPQIVPVRTKNPIVYRD